MFWDGKAAAMRTHRRRWAVAAFSLPELMIALVILGLGLLIIAAALPAGLQYTSDSSALATGETAAEYAMNTLTQRLVTSRELGRFPPDPSPDDTNYMEPLAGQRVDPLFRPRIPNGGMPGGVVPYAHLAGRLNPASQYRAKAYDLATAPPVNDPFDPNFEMPALSWQPLIKLRPFVGLNIDPTVRIPANNPGGTAPQINQEVEDSEEHIRAWLAELAQRGWAPAGIQNLVTEVDLQWSDRWAGPGVPSLAVNPALPAPARVYPPVAVQSQFTVQDYFQELRNSWSSPRALPWDGSTRPAPPLLNLSVADARRLSESRYAWTAFYRRVSYAKDSDPLLYEIVVVVTRRPSVNHRYIAMDTQNAQLDAPVIAPQAIAGGAAGGVEPRLFPQPWLVVFDPQRPLPVAPREVYARVSAGGQYSTNLGDAVLPSRALRSDFVPPEQLRFYCTPEISRLLPKGSMFFPAVNDEVENGRGGPSSLQQGGGNPAEIGGFTPRAGRELPFYEVIDRPDDRTVVVKFNGFYPWVPRGSGPPDNANPDNGESWRWPVWVIPPLQNADGTLERKSPIVSVLRRTVRVPELRSADVQP